MTRLAVLSDTHVPSRADSIPDWVLDEISAADVAVHAGDFDSPAALDVVRSAADTLVAVSGNMDPRHLDLSSVETLSAGGVTFVVTHGTGPRHDYRERVAAIVREHAPDDARVVGVAGHTHSLLDEYVDDLRLLNPGSATGASPADEATMMVVTAADGDVDVTVRRD